jgi:hypothetical protein
MSTQADVRSIDTITFVKTALAAFAHETGQGATEVEMQAQRMVDWICVDQAAYWKTEVRRAGDVVNQAMKDLQHCRTYKKVGNNEPACAEEKKALEKAKKRLARAEQKAEAVRRWTPIVRQELQEAGVRLTRFREVIDIDCPRAMARLERMLRSLDDYTNASSPAAGRHGDTAAGSVARTLDEQPAPITPTTPPAGGAEATGSGSGT